MRNWQSWLFILPPFGFLAFAVLWPILYNLYLSLTKWDGLGQIEFVGLVNFERIIQDDRVWLALQNNLKWSFGALLVPPLLGLILAVLLTRPKRVIGRGVFRVIYFLPQTIAVAITAVIWRWIFATQNGPVNALLGALGLPWQPQWLADKHLAMPAVFVAYTWAATGFSMVIFQAAIVCIDESLFESAKIDGANWLQEIALILVPSIRQAITTVITVTAIWSFQIFDLIYLTTRGGPGDATYVLALDIYSSTFRSRDVGRGAALSSMLLVLVLAFAMLLLRLNKAESEPCK